MLPRLAIDVVPALDEEHPPMDEKLKDAHKHFRTVLACATLVATINGGGQSKLVSEHQAEENNLRSLLSYVPTVLVRNNEVIAAVAHGPHPHTLASGAASGSLHLNIVQNAPPFMTFGAGYARGSPLSHYRRLHTSQRTFPDLTV